LGSSFELSSFGFFQKGSVKEVATFVAREVVQRSDRGELESVKHREYVCHCQIFQNNLAVCALSDDEYPQRVAFSLIQQASDLFQRQYDASKWNTAEKDQSMTVTGLDALLLKFQDPSEADKISKIKKDLEETKTIVYKSIEQMLERGDRLEDLASKSNDLSFQSKAFMKQAEKMNSCCLIL
jgi:synaptobrevin family protein YKT6